MSIHASTQIPTFDDIRQAAVRIAPHAQVTPVLRSASLERLAGCRLHFKCENFQRAGAFKFRGAANAVFGLSEAQAARGVLTQSSGNHGAAIALACRLRGIPARVVVPRNANATKVAAIRDFGAEVIFCEPGIAARDAALREVLEQHGGEVVHPYNDARVIAGQGTATLELLAAQPQLDTVLAPVGGGGLLSGMAIAAQTLAPGIRVFGAEPEQARDAHDSLERGVLLSGQPVDTICDGLRGELGTLTFAILRERADGILLASEAEIVEAMRLVWQRLKILIEPSCAVPLAVVLKNPQLFAGREVGMILSGGNVDLDALPW